MELMPRLERELAPPIVGALEARGLLVAEEVFFNGRIADVVGVDTDGRVVTVELKLRDWRTAHRQAIAYQVGAHHSYVALPLVVVERHLKRDHFRAAFAESGCGLLAVNHPFGEVREVVAPHESPRCLDFMAEHLTRLVTSVHAAAAASPAGGDPAVSTGSARIT